MERSSCAGSLSRHIINESGFYAPVMKWKHKLAVKAHEEYMQNRSIQNKRNTFRSKTTGAKFTGDNQKHFQNPASLYSEKAKEQNYQSSTYYPVYNMKQPDPAVSSSYSHPQFSKQIPGVWYPTPYGVPGQYSIPYPLTYY
ncbi:hypothetical protein SPOG_02819 [Schizosaccharomyces cryophilus OY26]|uniref:Uncharacterized protein n=1 Tax=Schizosaccharomyces cryophilus (strain OY26 / ATCC MYA-4695 / CBS 11777 / NBRC 106824 / NRRL Y48691) TaxID=653667 RepID=S9W1Q4_SCHCR|nr:uncharacterized protein SPOG_02819 [Schizosaccharomyces cryophilus OY26]EPY53958.1 hypothetical protein SPOG_02819 [Schizosaccharomyces cryophilus OY26]